MQRSTKIAATITCAGLVAGLGAAVAVQQPAYLQARPALEVASGPQVRAVRDIRVDRMPRAMARPWAEFVSNEGGSWTAVWDTATGVPNRIYGSGISVPGSSADAGIAGRYAEQLLERHIDLFAPGSSVSDFAMVANVVHRDMRSIGFVQTYHGMPVIGGQVSFRFKNDRMFVIGTEALPHVDARHGLSTIKDSVARHRAQNWIADTSSTVAASAVDGPLVLPLVGNGSVHHYVTVVRVQVDAKKPIGRWDVYLDAQTGDRVAREQTLHFADGVIEYEASVRLPSGDRATYPAQDTDVNIDGDPLQTDDGGNVTWASAAAGALTTSVNGPLVDVDNAAGDDATETFSIAPGGSILWNAHTDQFIDAQINSFIHARLVKDYSRSMNPGLEWLNATLPVNVNIDETCNAFSDGNSINFFIKSDQCQNTARLADVVYHEFGHSLHANSVIPGVGAFTSAHSEGLSDYLAATITNDPAMGRGFFNSEGPLRHIDPTGKEHIWPNDVAGAHFTGLIFAGAMWDLRKVLIDKYGLDEGVRLSDRLYYATLQRGSSIPSTYVEVLAEDDDDGDLSNGTPNICDINVTFAAHGLRVVAAEVTSLSAELPSPSGHDIALRVTGLFEQCPGDSVDSATIEWRLRGDEEIQTVEMAENGDDFLGTIPEIEAGKVVHYSVRVSFNDGLSRVFPDNPADTEYQFFVGETVPLYCTGFETDPFLEGWEHGLASGEQSEGADDWTWGAPLAGPESGDPPSAFAGDFVIGNDLGGGDFNGQYQGDKVNFTHTPSVEVGQYTDVHLQYWRWLTVEDAFFDQATIYANNHQAWQNLNSDNGNNSALHHQDREWRFQDVPISQFVEDGALRLRFELASDSGLNMGGWTMDDYCIMAYAGSICGDGEITGVETCDDGDDNSDEDSNACRTSCKQAFCGDGIVDSGETCDDGNDENNDSCNNACNGDGGTEGGDCGCVVGGPGAVPTGGLLILAFAFGLFVVGRRRRRR